MLSNQQKRHLKAMAHPLRPVVIVGDNGLTEAVLAELENAIDHHELVKVKIRTGDRDGRQEMVMRLCEQTGAQLVQRVGHIVTLFRRNPDTPRITLP